MNESRWSSKPRAKTSLPLPLPPTPSPPAPIRLWKKTRNWNGLPLTEIGADDFRGMTALTTLYVGADFALDWELAILAHDTIFVV